MARIAKYAAKLGVFIVVPGLHQIACKRRILGGLLMALYFAAEFTLSNKPLNFSVSSSPTDFLPENLKEVIQFFSWILLALDIKKLEKRILKPNLFLFLACAAGIYFVPNHDPGVLNIHIEDRDIACPTFCKHDIVEYELYDNRVHKILVGDYILLGIMINPKHLAKVLVAGPPAEACARDGRTVLQLPVRNSYCRKDVLGRYLYQLLVLGGPDPEYKNPDGKDVSLVAEFRVHGVGLRKVGNIRQYFILSEGITDVVGHVLLTVYEWTGLNLFRLSN